MVQIGRTYRIIDPEKRSNEKWWELNKGAHQNFYEKNLAAVF
jgi:virulence-associated protein VagC